MSKCLGLMVIAAVLSLIFHEVLGSLTACCPAPPSGKPVVNADQTVIIIWDAATKTQHFIRKATFKSDAEDFGFIVPTPSQPELSESGNDAFPLLQKLTEPIVKTMKRPNSSLGCSCGDSRPLSSPTSVVRVLEVKRVAGFQATVLEADSATALVTWLQTNGYAFSPEVEAWAKPYVDGHWKFTALKVAKGKDGESQKSVAAAALRLTFKTDRPVFPYREPDTRAASAALGARNRLLRIYFLAEGRYLGELTNDARWTGRVAWAGNLSTEARQNVLRELKLPEGTGPFLWYLTEFEDDWPYRLAPADVCFAPNRQQDEVRRPAIIEYVQARWPGDAMVYAIAATVLFVPLMRRMRGLSTHLRSES